MHPTAPPGKLACLLQEFFPGCPHTDEDFRLAITSGGSA
jgi:hypothetical protein